MHLTEFQQFYGMLPEPMVLVSHDDRVLACNPAAGELFGRSNIPGISLRELTVDTEGRLNRFLSMCRRTHELLPGAITIRRSDGATIACRLEGALLAGTGYILLRFLAREATTSRFIALNERIESLNRHIAERRRAEAALAETNETLRRANADLEQFAYSASHDLREPLRIVALFSELVRTKYSGRIDCQADQYLSFIFQAALRMENLLADLLAFIQVVKGNEGLPEVPVDADRALDCALDNLAAAIQDCGGTIIRKPLPKVLMKEVHLIQLFQNLVGNALKYRGQATPVIHIDATMQGETWRISVRDNGIGIAPEYAEQIFGIFKRLHSAEYPGTGMGLAICQKIVHRYRGRIWVESDGEGLGSSFHFTLPGAKPLASQGSTSTAL